MPEIIQALGIRDGSSVADVGAGGGFFTVRLAREVGSAGHVYAVDITSDNVRKLRDRAKQEGLSQVEVIHGEADDPRLAQRSLDAALIINAYHEMRSHQAVLRVVRRALKPGARLVIVEPIVESRRDDSRERQERSHEVGPRFVEADLRAAGFEVIELRDPFTKRPSGDTEWMIVATPSSTAPLSSAGDGGSSRR